MMKIIHVEFVDLFDDVVGFARSAEIVNKVIFGELDSARYHSKV